MKSKKILLIALICMLVTCTNVPAFAAEHTTNEVDTIAASVEPKAATLVTSGHFKTSGKSNNFYISGGAVKAFYLTLTGDSNSYVNFTVYRGSTPVWNGSYKANGDMHTKTLIPMLAGNYHIEFNTASSKTIIYAMSWNA